jgi:hypothetical protein
MYAPEMLEQDDSEAPPRIGYAALQGLKVDANGQISYDFDGHIKARGLDFDTTPPLSAISWRDPSDPNPATNLAAQIVGDTTPGVADFLTLLAGTNNQAEIDLTGVDGASGAKITLLAGPAIGGVQKTLLNDSGQSDFLQLRATANIRLQGPYSVLVPAIAAGAFATVFDNQADVSGLTLTAVFGSSRVAAGNQRISLHGHNIPGGPGLNLLFYNPTAAASVANIPFVYCVVSVV